MVRIGRKITITVDNWLFDEIEKRRKVNRSEFVTEHLVKGMQVLPEIKDDTEQVNSDAE